MAIDSYPGFDGLGPKNQTELLGPKPSGFQEISTSVTSVISLWICFYPVCAQEQFKSELSCHLRRKAMQGTMTQSWRVASNRSPNLSWIWGFPHCHWCYWSTCSCAWISKLRYVTIGVTKASRWMTPRPERKPLSGNDAGPVSLLPWCLDWRSASLRQGQGGFGFGMFSTQLISINHNYVYNTPGSWKCWSKILSATAF